MFSTCIFLSYYWLWWSFFTFAVEPFYFWSQWFLFWNGLFKFRSLWKLRRLFRFKFSLDFSHRSVDRNLFLCGFFLFSIRLHRSEFYIVFLSSYDIFFLLLLALTKSFNNLDFDAGSLIAIFTTTHWLCEIQNHDMFLRPILLLNIF